MNNTRIVELDGIRGAAALAVLIAHYFGEVPHGIRGLMVGWIGVDVFFVLSGFLIGSIILAQHREPQFFRTFYLRRAARIIPIYAVVCAVTLTLAAATAGNTWSDDPYEASVYATFLQNVAMAVWGGGGKWLQPTWTLAVEEQFYLVLPALIVVTPRKWLLTVVVALSCAALVVRLMLAPSMAALTLLPSRMDLLLCGVGVAVLHREYDLSRHVTHLRLVAIVPLWSIAALAAVSNDYVATWGHSLLGVGIAALLLAIINGAPEGRHFRSATLGWFGTISYALYLVHQPIAGLLHGVFLGGTPDIGSGAQVLVTCLAAVASVGLAKASWRWLEAPILARARRVGVSHAPTAPVARAA
jgi:peptidoglycan/LPS O-acetylase OafA/YrhL